LGLLGLGLLGRVVLVQGSSGGNGRLGNVGLLARLAAVLPNERAVFLQSFCEGGWGTTSTRMQHKQQQKLYEK
jgi:hypothetical protein